MRMTILVSMMLCLMSCDPVFAYEQDETLAALEGLIESPEQIRLTAFLTKHKVLRAPMYAQLICQEIQTPAERKLFAVKLVKESRGRTTAVSPKGAVGPWQVMPFWARQFKMKVADLRNPRTNLKTALKVYKIHLADSKGKVWGKYGAIWRYSGGDDMYVADAARMIRTV